VEIGKRNFLSQFSNFEWDRRGKVSGDTFSRRLPDRGNSTGGPFLVSRTGDAG